MAPRTKKPTLTSEEIIDKFKAEYRLSLVEHINGLDVEDEVHKTIKSLVDSSIIELLGLEKDSWNNKWKVNCCNGFNRVSEIGKLLNNKVVTSLEQYRESFVPPELTDAQKASMLKYYKDEVQSCLTRIARERAHADANKLADILLK